jgi:hypothetical protein
MAASTMDQRLNGDSAAWVCCGVHSDSAASGMRDDASAAGITFDDDSIVRRVADAGCSRDRFMPPGELPQGAPVDPPDDGKPDEEAATIRTQGRIIRVCPRMGYALWIK